MLSMKPTAVHFGLTLIWAWIKTCLDQNYEGIFFLFSLLDQDRRLGNWQEILAFKRIEIIFQIDSLVRLNKLSIPNFLTVKAV